MHQRRRRQRSTGNLRSSYNSESSLVEQSSEEMAEPEIQNPLPTFAGTEMKMGRVLGKGGFSVVSELQSIKLDEVYDTSEEETRIRKEFAMTCSGPDRTSRYVVKMLRTDLPEDEHTKGVVDLAIEAEFLKDLVHPNIIKMRALANSDPHESKFFVILDRLVITLERKMNFWRTEVGENIGMWMGPCLGYCCAKSNVLHRLWMERLMVSRDIAMALQFLHSRGVVYRDLKPDNVGFDAGGEVKLFDFGLAKRLSVEDKADGELYNLTGNTGSLRYMAPEVANCEPYDHRVDAYSFGILFWQICSLTTPYLGYSTKMHAERVIGQGYRPKPDQTWPLSWVKLMKDSWATDILSRPDFNHVVHVLDEEVTQLLREEGVVPSRASEIKAKKRKKKRKEAKKDIRLDVDTRLSTSADPANVRKHDSSII
mmetsp:Transcript_17474/g.29633  ORF Transcript_17474/g.29633 Transcript_17474/m.29633 type:complete len:425 (-) Transcript_17474:1656-2930(-)